MELEFYLRYIDDEDDVKEMSMKVSIPKDKEKVAKLFVKRLEDYEELFIGVREIKEEEWRIMM